MPSFLRLPLLILLGLVCSYSGMAYAQNQEAPANSLRKGAWALQFGVSQNFTLTSLEGSTISAKHHFSDQSALRYGLTLDGRFGSDRGGTEEDADLQRKSNEQSLALSTEYIRYPDLEQHPLDALHLYWGVGPDVSFTRNRRQTFPDSVAATTYGWGVGIGGVVGAEWFVARRISLIAEYGSVLRYNYDATKTKPGSAPGPTLIQSRKTFGLYSQGVKFGISVYVRPGE